MLNLVSAADVTLRLWLVQLQLDHAAGARPPLGDDDVAPMVELLYRTEGVRSVAVVPLAAGLAVAVGLEAPDATSALERARGLAISCARYAGLGEIVFRRACVTPAPHAGTA